MGIIKRGILGGFSGRVANVVGGSWKGKAYMRSLPLSVANPKTAAQVGQRTKFSTIQAIASILLVVVIKPCWDRFAQGMSGYNNFIKSNIDAISTAGAVTYASLKTSIGSLTGVQDLVGTASNGTTESIGSWTDNSGVGGALATDQGYMVGYCVELDEWSFEEANFVRSDESQDLAWQSNLTTGDTIHLYVNFRRPDGTLVSDSSYDEITVTA